MEVNALNQQQKKQTGLDATQIMLMKNEKIRENYTKRMATIKTEEQRTVDELDKVICDVRREIRDMDAYNIVYQANSLKTINRGRHKSTYNSYVKQTGSEVMIITGGAKPETKTQDRTAPTPITPSLPPPRTAAPKKVRHKLKDNTIKDPFRVKECLQDVEHDLDDRDTKPRPPPIAAQATNPAPTRRRPVRRSFTAPVQSSGYKSLIPGNCSSYYSIRKFYDQEKDKVIHQWSPEEKRKKAVQYVIANLKLPSFSLMRQKTTSAIFRDFRKFKQKPEKQTGVDELTPLPNILNVRLPSTGHAGHSISSVSV